jgi:hypothetical protein
MDINKAENRDKKSFKNRYGMEVSGRGVFVIQATLNNKSKKAKANKAKKNKHNKK